MALTAGQIPIVANVPKSGVGLATASANTVTLGSDSNGATVYTAGTKGGRVTSLMASTNDTVAVNIFVYILSGGTVIPLGQVNIPISSGNVASVFNVDCLDGTSLKGLPIDNSGKRYIPLGVSEVLKFGAVANLTALKTAYLSALGADYQA